MNVLRGKCVATSSGKKWDSSLETVLEIETPCYIFMFIYMTSGHKYNNTQITLTKKTHTIFTTNIYTLGCLLGAELS